MATKKESTKKPDNGDGSTPEPVLASPEVPAATEAAITPATPGIFDSNPLRALAQARQIIEYLNELIKPRMREFVGWAGGAPYPTHKWWGAMGAPLGCFARTVNSERVGDYCDRDGQPARAYRATVEVWHVPGDRVVTRAVMICAEDEETKKKDGTITTKRNLPDHSLESWAQTRGMSKAFRMGFPFMPLLAGLQPLSYEEAESVVHVMEGPPEIELEAVPDDIKEMMRELGVDARGKARAKLYAFMKQDGTLNLDGARRHFSAQIDQRIENGGE